MKLVYFFVAVCFVAQTTAKKTYRAAVVEFTPNDDIPLSNARINRNTASYIEFIEEAAKQYVEIIVFPEFGLTGWANLTDETIDELSTEVPDSSSQISPCQNPKPNFSKHLIDLSCAAASYKVYTVVNLIEKFTNETKDYYYNTNVVFDRNGIAIARYRKINLFNEPVFSPGTELVTFETDFGVNFGMIICADISHRNPSVNIVANSSNIIDSASWFSHLPFYGSLSVQHGYVKSNGVNLLASGLNYPSTKNGGSGIYWYNGKIAQAYISGIRGSRLIIDDVPIITIPAPVSKCQSSRNEDSGKAIKLPGLVKGSLLDISSFFTSREDLSNYTVKAIDTNTNVISETVCSDMVNFCCTFDIAMTRDPKVAKVNYAYKIMVHYGVSQISMDGTIGVSNCILVACLNETDSTCGGRHKEEPKGITFDSISVKGRFNVKDTYVQPSTLTYELLPVTDYTFCKKDEYSQVEFQIKTTKKLNSILTFGFYGRDYSLDGSPVGPLKTESLN